MNFNIWLEQIERSDLYWISPDGRISGESKGHEHIRQVCNDPNYFGFTKEKIKKVYEKHDEIFSQNGQAQREIIVDLLRQEWVKITKNNNLWIIQVGFFNENVKKNISNWIWSMITIGHSNKDNMKLIKTNGSEEYTSFEDWLKEVQ